MIGLVLTIAMLAVAALLIGGVRLMNAARDRKRGLLMIAVAAVLLANVAILAWPVGR